MCPTDSNLLFSRQFLPSHSYCTNNLSLRSSMISQVFPSQLIYLFSPSKSIPILAILPSNNPNANAPIPLSNLLTCNSLMIHLGLALLLYPEKLQAWFQSRNLKPLPYPAMYTFSAIAPVLSVLSGRAWQTTVWWSLTGALVSVVQTVQESIIQGNQSVAELEKLKYVAPGA
jgi:hypothetical protein